MKIRIAKMKDAESITALNLALAKESENIILDFATVLEGVNALLSDCNKGFYVVAEEEKTIIGQLMITYEWSDWRNKPIWWVQSVYVLKEYRKKGVFTHLLLDIQHKARRQGVGFLRLYMHTQNTSAQKVYDKSGWIKENYVVYRLLL